MDEKYLVTDDEAVCGTVEEHKQFRIEFSRQSSCDDAMIKELIEVVTASSSSATNDNNLAGSLAVPSNLPTAAPTNNDQSAVTIKQEIIKAMLVKSFMRPLKGKNKEHCSMGHKLELPIALDWMRDVNEKKLFPGFTVISLHKIGLVEKKITLGPKIPLIFWHWFEKTIKMIFKFGVLRSKVD